MPFCCRKKSKLNLQIPRAWKMWSPCRRTGRRVSPGASAKGSMTVEASFALPFLLCAVTALLYLFTCTSVQAKESMELMGRARLLAVTAGQGYGSDPYVKLADADLVSLPFLSVPSGRRLITRRAVVRAWVGYTGETFQKDAGEELVYITPDGTVYHKTRDCSYLRLSIRLLSYESLQDERNLSGSRYTPCIYCVRPGRTGGIVYITNHGTSYHSSMGCRGLKRTVMAVPLSGVEGRNCCSSCRR